MPASHQPPLFDQASQPRSGQLSFADVGTPLHDVTFVTVDLETTGAHAQREEITEIGAVKTLGGEVVGEFSTLVRPEQAVISAFVERLTGITNGMVAGAPTIHAVLPSFLEFSRGAVLVAHNAGFDIGFLKAACARLDYQWPNPHVLDTVRLARHVVPRPEVRNHKLATLAQHFATQTPPTHRALDDARATNEILHHLFERFGSYGITTLEELGTVRTSGWQKRQRKSHLARDVPALPGVYMFLDGSRRTLYIGTSRNMAARVRQYFNAGETRGRMTEMITATQEVSTLVCETVLEANVREVRLIAELQPPYNRRSKNAHKRAWLRLTDEPYPRLSVTRTPPAADRPERHPRLGPFRSQATAQRIKDTLERVVSVKRCTRSAAAARRTPCAAAEMGRCAGPCIGQSQEEYLTQLTDLVSFLSGDSSGLLEQIREAMIAASATQRYERAAEIRDLAADLLRTTVSDEQRRGLYAVPEIIAAQPREYGNPAAGDDVALIRYGKLAGSAHVAHPSRIPEVVSALQLTGEHVDEPVPGTGSTYEEETDIVLRWLQRSGTQLLSVTGTWCAPRCGHAFGLHTSGFAPTSSSAPQ